MLTPALDDSALHSDEHHPDCRATEESPDCDCGELTPWEPDPDIDGEEFAAGLWRLAVQTTRAIVPLPVRG